MEIVEPDDRLVRAAADIALTHGLRGYDAIHCASAQQVADDDLLAAAGDARLLSAWMESGTSTHDTN
ncbi:PIN domain-containing protein [Jatrophihabitans sp. GAS493]|nr:PIN domain-containing protein [Jatrophihabitans sp. GAS493]